MTQDLARLWKLYCTVGRLLPGYFLTGTAVACRNYFITLLNVYLGANVATQCAAGNLSGLGQALLRFALFLALFLLFDASASYGYAQTLDRIRYALRSRIYKNILYAPLPAIEAVGQRLETLACASLRQTVTYVTQESALTSESIRANLTVGQPLDEPALSALLQGVRADSWIQTLPQKLETSVRELSGGQRQAVALARALARNTPVYLFDEVFAGIDQQRTAAIMTWLKTAYSDRLFLIITHDPSVMAACDYRIDVGT
ncbi:MAG: ATP-binding cassette domain-containing protein [Eubacteriales bacterium]|nr:ATP-binding cassette domain-containing protein [Eubacteriales bacterium]MDY5346626.1 ATP-binding cassette domain-containing protein [Eubacteriales bacterium]